MDCTIDKQVGSPRPNCVMTSPFVSSAAFSHHILHFLLSNCPIGTFSWLLPNDDKFINFSLSSIYSWHRWWYKRIWCSARMERKKLFPRGKNKNADNSFRMVKIKMPKVYNYRQLEDHHFPPLPPHRIVTNGKLGSLQSSTPQRLGSLVDRFHHPTQPPEWKPERRIQSA